MHKELVHSPAQRHAVEKFFYFFMGLRKGEIRARVAKMKTDFPDLSPEQLARVLIAEQTPLSLLGGSLLHLPMVVPGIGPVLKLLGVAGGAAVIMQMHLSLILEIALLFGRNIDDQARVKEMAAVIAASGLASASTMASEALSLKPLFSFITGGLAVTVVSHALGEAAIRYYGGASTATLDGNPREANLSA
jgi:hypothetical protein